MSAPPRRLWAALILLVCLAGAALAAPRFPELTGRVVDEANVLSPDLEVRLAAQSQALEQKTGAQLVVVTLASLQDYDIADYGYQLGRAWGLGREGEDDGLLLIIAPNERKVRVEVGYGLEGVVTDAFSSLVLQREVLPRFREGDLPGGVEAGARALAEQVAADPERQQEALAAAAEADEEEDIDPAALIWILFIVAWILISATRNRGRRWRGGGWGGPPVIIWGGGGGRSGGFGGGGGFGGFSGGGGSFGGGGASGSW